MSRKKLKTEEDFIEKDPYKSIINILSIAPEFNPLYNDGLEPKELRDLIIKDYAICSQRADKQRLDMLSDFKEYLQATATDKIRLHQDIKPGRYKGTSTTFYHLFNDYLERLEKKGWLERKRGRILLDKKYKCYPLRSWREKIITNRSTKNILLERYFSFYPPKSITVDRFTREDRIQLNKIVNDFLSSLDGIIKKIRNEKKGEIWDKKIINSDRVNPLVKLYLWVHRFTDTICSSSPKIFLSVTTKKLRTNKGILPREKAIEEWEKQEINLRREIFNDILNDLWQDKNISAEDEKQVNLLLKEGYEESYPYFMDVMDEMQIDPMEEYAFVISPIVSGEEIHRKNKTTEYMESIPWLNLRWRKWDDKITQAFNYIRSVDKQLGLIDTKEVEIAGIKIKTECVKTDEGEKPVIPCDTSLDGIGETWFNHFNSDLRNKLLDFCVDLGYKNEKQLFKVIGEFASIFHFPFVPDPNELFKTK